VGVLDDDFAFVAASALRAARLQREACQAVVDDPTVKRGTALAKHLTLAYDAIERRIGTRIDQFNAVDDESVKDDAIREMRRLVWDVRKLQHNLSWIDAAQNPPLDLGTTYYVEDIARSLVSDDVEVTIVATEGASYATNSDPYEPLIRDWGSGTPANEPTVIVVFIPRRERDSGLLHPLIVHELGHAADDAHGVIDDVWSLAVRRKRLAKRFVASAVELARTRSQDPQRASETIAEMLRGWMTECMCDCIAVHHLGPTYLYSFLAEVVAGTLDETALRHPPPRQRMRYLLDYLGRLGWHESMKTAHPKLYAWIDEVADFEPSYEGVGGFLVWAIEDLRAVVRRHTERLVGTRIFHPVPEELDEVKRLLEIGVPPSQRHSGKAVLPATIMLACWDAALGDRGGTAEVLASAPDSSALSEVLPAALEQSALAGVWPR
jgi:hypothetical protein